MNHMREAFIDQRRKQVVDVVKSGCSVLLVGVDPHRNLPPELRTHPSLIAWHGDNGLHKKSLPANVGIVLMTRFSSHADVGRITADAKKAGVPCPSHPFTTGELRSILEPLAEVQPPAKANGANGHPAASRLVAPGGVIVRTLPEPAKEEEQPPEPAEPAAEPTGKEQQRAKHGALRAFIEAHADLDAKPASKEARRLLPMAVAAGLTATTEGSIAQAILLARTRLAITPLKKGFTLERRPEETTTMLQTTAPAPPPPATASVEVMTTDEQDVLALFGDAIASMQLARERFTLLLERQKGSAALKQELLNLANRM